MALQPNDGPIRSSTYLAADPTQVFWGRLPCAVDPPVLRIDPGTEVTIDTISHEGVLEDQGRDPAAYFARHGVDPSDVLTDAVALAASAHPRDPAVDGPHVITGPIEVCGAQVGDLLRMTVLEHVPRVPYGVISNRHGRGALVGEYPTTADNVSVFADVRRRGGQDVGSIPLRPQSEERVHFPLAPFLGIMGVAAGTEHRSHSVPPGAYGGNIDINLLTAGSSLYLPVQVAGGMAYVGDPHFAQGDGEVALTAMEASLRSTIRFDVVAREDAVAAFGELVGPLAETEEYLVPTGLDEDLDVAVRNCVRAAIALLVARYAMDPAHAYAYLSAATDFDISQVVDVVQGVHARIRVEDFR